ncbi:MAG: C39 family peptidase [bacterium]|nr:C39 family peptidase [bacterium]
MRRGYRAKIYTYNLHIFDPTWFDPTAPDLRERLERQKALKDDPKLRFATDAYIEYLHMGGELAFEDLTHSLIRRHLIAGHPILTGLSATYLYSCARESPDDCRDDDIGGYPSGHFVVLYGYNKERRTVMVADPLTKDQHYYEVEIHRLVNSILLGIVTYDANLLVIEPLRSNKGDK